MPGMVFSQRTRSSPRAFSLNWRFCFSISRPYWSIKRQHTLTDSRGPGPAASPASATAVPPGRTHRSPARALPADAAPRVPDSSIGSSAVPAWPAAAPVAAAPALLGPPSTTRAADRSATDAPASPSPPGRSSAWPKLWLSLAADAPAPTASPLVPPPRETLARSRRLPPPPAPPVPETAESSGATPPPHCSPLPPAPFSLLLPRPSCNKIFDEDLRQRGSSGASFRACASSTYPTLGGTLRFHYI